MGFVPGSIMSDRLFNLRRRWSKRSAGSHSRRGGALCWADSGGRTRGRTEWARTHFLTIPVPRTGRRCRKFTTSGGLTCRLRGSAAMPALRGSAGRVPTHPSVLALADRSTRSLAAGAVRARRTSLPVGNVEVEIETAALAFAPGRPLAFPARCAFRSAGGDVQLADGLLAAGAVAQDGVADLAEVDLAEV